MPRKRDVRELYYITHIGNLPSILNLGILSHQRIEDEGVEFEPIYDRVIVAGRKARAVPDGRSLWRFTNLFFQPRNPMLYRVGPVEGRTNDLAVLAVRREVLDSLDAYISLGNAASPASEIVPAADGRKAIPEILRWADNEFWTQEVGLKRKIMAELLVSDRVPPDLIQTIFVGTHAAADSVRRILATASEPRPPTIVEPHMFFQPTRVRPLTPLLKLVEGDMFFSRLQTLTVSVNTVRVMGKGVASRAKYQFPDVYVRYQDVCRAGRLKMGKPYIYKRESSLDRELADEPGTLTGANGDTWFLLFPTKRDWREAADLPGIEEGLEWIDANYKREGIGSLAIPALGCGLGRLKWSEAGPVICGHLASLEIPVRLYLPAEKKIPDEQLTEEFLLRGVA